MVRLRNHFSWVPVFLRVLGPRLRTSLIVILILQMLQAAMNFFSIGSVAPLLAIAVDPKSRVATEFTRYLTMLTGPLSSEQVLLLMSMVMGIAVTLAAAFKALAVVLGARFQARVRTELSIRVMETFAKESYEQQVATDANRRISIVTSDTAGIAGLANEVVSLFSQAAMVAMMIPKIKSSSGIIA